MCHGWTLTTNPEPAEEEMQNAYYNGWLHNHFVGFFFAFAPSRIVVAFTLNTPEHNSFITENGGIYTKLESFFYTGGKAVVNMDFSGYQKVGTTGNIGYVKYPILENQYKAMSSLVLSIACFTQYKEIPLIGVS